MRLGKMSGVLYRLARRFGDAQGGKKGKARKRKARRAPRSGLAKALRKLFK